MKDFSLSSCLGRLPRSLSKYAGLSTQATAYKYEEQQEEEGPMSRRLSEMTDEVVQKGSKSASKAIDEAGFSEELKQRLQERIEATRFKSENAAAFAQATLPV